MDAATASLRVAVKRGAKAPLTAALQRYGDDCDTISERFYVACDLYLDFHVNLACYVSVAAATSCLAWCVYLDCYVSLDCDVSLDCYVYLNAHEHACVSG